MDATTQVIETFDRLVSLGDSKRANMSRAEQILWLVVVTRCSTDMDGFESVFDQAIKEREVTLLVDGLRSIHESELANAFHRALQLLQRENFYAHFDMRKMPEPAQRQLQAIEKDIGNRLWDLDEKLAALLDAE